MKIYLRLRKSSFNSEISLLYLLNQWDFPHGRLCGFVALKTHQHSPRKKQGFTCFITLEYTERPLKKKQRNICLGSSYFLKYTWLFSLESIETGLPFGKQKASAQK